MFEKAPPKFSYIVKSTIEEKKNEEDADYGQENEKAQAPKREWRRFIRTYKLKEFKGQVEGLDALFEYDLPAEQKREDLSDTT